MAPRITREVFDAVNNLMAQGRQGAILPVTPGIMYGPGMDAAGAATGMAFLVGELEKQDPRLLEPLTSITAPRDIIMKSGGGWVSNVSNVFVDYATTGNDEDAIIAGETTNIPTSQANMTKDLFKVNTFAEVLRVPILDENKLQQIGKSLNQILDDGLRLNFNKIQDRNVYVGISKTGTYGLVNNTAITSGYVAAGASASRLWTNKTPDEILYDINYAINYTWAQSEYDLTGMANHILIPPANFADIVSRKVSTAGNVSILAYLLENNIAKNQGRDLKIYPSRWCIGAGTGVTGRMVCYVNAENRVNMHNTVPLSRVMTAPNTQSVSYETVYAAQFSQVIFLYLQCALYQDGI
jgi:hypothetical protein